MRTSRPTLLAAALILSALAANAQVPPTPGAAPPDTVPLTSLIADVAHKTGKKFVLDPRVRAQVRLIGDEPSNVTYDELLTILDTYGYMAVQTGEYVLVVPEAYARQEPLPLVTGNETRPDGEYVTAIIHVRSIPAGWLVPILRPLVPQSGHFVTLPCANALIMVDRFANVRRMRSIVKSLDTGAPIKPPRCVVPMPRPWGSIGPARPAPPSPHPPAP
jgi:general secretion pathway protein D